MIARRSNLFFIFTGILLVLLGLIFIHASLRVRADELSLQEKAEMVRRLGLTDLCLFTDARYTRHPSVADLNTPFQDYPMSFEHFPSGSLMTVPPHLKYRSVSDSVSVREEKGKIK